VYLTRCLSEAEEVEVVAVVGVVEVLVEVAVGDAVVVLGNLKVCNTEELLSLSKRTRGGGPN